MSASYRIFLLQHFSYKVQSALLMQLHVLLWLFTGGRRIFLLYKLMVELIFGMQLGLSLLLLYVTRNDVYSALMKSADP